MLTTRSYTSSAPLKHLRDNFFLQTHNPHRKNNRYSELSIIWRGEVAWAIKISG
jgi:hypothetical protein